MSDDELTTGNERADQLLRRIRSLGEGPAPAPRRELARLLTGQRRPPRRRLWLVGGLSAVVIAGGAGTTAAAAHGLMHPWSGAIDSLSRLWSHAPTSAAQAHPLTGTAPAHTGRDAGSGVAGRATSGKNDTSTHQDATPRPVRADRPPTGSGATAGSGHSGDHQGDPGDAVDPAGTGHDDADSGGKADGDDGDTGEQSGDDPASSGHERGDDPGDGGEGDAGNDSGDGSGGGSDSGD